ncbi:MAG: hypothetical protein CME62_12860 [Halobacteriovoraceae bacterium]|nr:hypothetical protein [Halobacteriovoraceae bacterium]|tara:strand:+ start:18175 stop:20049 length:1875 start_codon:yes stop_codon:yes gene_type:complete
MSQNTENLIKNKKKKGIIRTEAVIPLVIFIAIIVVFNIFFLDTLIRKSIEFIGEKANGAEVNVSSVTTSFKNLSVDVKRIQVTDKSNPDFNTFEIGQMNFKMLWDALLRGKVVIEKAHIGNILVQTKRASRGYVIPAQKNAPGKTTQVLNAAEKEFEGNVFGDIAAAASGKDLGIAKDKIKGDLASQKGLEKINQQIDKKNNEMQKALKAVPTPKELKDLEKRLRDIKWSDLGNLAKAPAVLKEADELKRDIEKANKAVNQANKSVNENIKNLENSYAQTKNLVNQDIENIAKRFNLPTLDPKSIAKMIFGNELMSKLKDMNRYKAMVKEYVPERKNKPEEPLIRPREDGRDFHFGTPKSYPIFWLKLASIDSKNDQGMVAGKLENITTNQRQINKTTTATINGDFPAKNIRDVMLKADLDLKKEPILNINSKVGNFIVTDKSLSNSKDVTFKIQKANTESLLKAKVTPEHVSLKLDNNFRQINFETKAESETVTEILNSVAQRTKVLTLDARANGAWDDIKFEIKSSLADAIISSTKALVQEKIDKARAQIKADIEQEIAAKKSEVEGKITGLKSQYEKEVKKANAELDKLKGKLEKEKKAAEKKAKKGLGGALDGALKGIKL